MTTPGPPRYPLYADDTTDSVEAHADPDARPTPPPADPTSYLDDQDLDDDYERRMVPAWLPWVLVALMLVLVAVGGVWLLLSARRRLRHGATGRVGLGVPGHQ